MRAVRSPRLGEVVRPGVVAVASLGGATIAVAILQDGLGVSGASMVYLVAVVVTALLTGTVGAIGAAIAAFLLYDFLFIEPRYTLTVAEPSEWLGVVLLLFVGVVVGQLAALQRARREQAEAREREAVAQFRLSRALATRVSTPAVLPEVTQILAAETAMARIWISLGADDATERVAADTSEEPRPAVGLAFVLRRMPGEQPAEWVRVHQPVGRARSAAGGPPQPAGAARGPAAGDVHRVRIEAEGQPYGSIWSLRPRGAAKPGQTETRLLSAAADLVGLALDHDRLAAEAQAAEIARASDALKSALLQSVSHDLRTPLATIRAAAGSLRPGTGLSSQDQAESAAAIDREVEYLNRLVTNLLDLSRIEAGALRAERDAFELEDLLGPAIERLRGRLGERPLEVAIDAPPVLVDPIFLDDAVTNVLENAAKYTPSNARIRIAAGVAGSVAAGAAAGGATAGVAGPGRVRLTIEDAGPGVPTESLPRLFDKFYRVPRRDLPSRTGTGIGLAVVRGLVEAMGASVAARTSELGGLAIDIDMPMAPTVPEATEPAPAATASTA
jgi:two-component system sensor histidine kinase KdpD